MTDQNTTAAQTPSADADKERLPEPYEKTTRHTITLDGREWRYDATLGTIAIDTAKVKPAASIFFAAFNAVDDQGATDPTRPVTFIFNGGPGSSSTFLLLGFHRAQTHRRDRHRPRARRPLHARRQPRNPAAGQ